MTDDPSATWAMERARELAPELHRGWRVLNRDHEMTASKIAPYLDAARAEGRRDAFSHAADVAMFRAHDTINMGAYDEDHDWEAQALRTSAAGAYRDIESRLRALAGDPPKEP